MVKYIKEKLSPGKGFAHLFHLSFVAVVPVLVLIFARLDLIGIAAAVILISKWRMISVKPRYWIAHLRTNAVDLIFSLSMLVFISQTNSFNWQLMWVLIYEIWILVIKPRESAFAVSSQAMIGQFAGLIALFLAFETVPLSAYILFVAFITYFSGRHFFSSFDEPHQRILSWIWAYISASLMWVLGHWLVFAGDIAMPAIVISVFSYVVAGLYYLYETDRLTPQIRKQFFTLIFAIMITTTIWLLKKTSIEI